MKLVYLSPVPWNSVAQRPHFFVKSALKHGFESVLWVEPTPSRLPKLIDLKTTMSSVEADSFPKDSRIKLLKPKMVPIEPLHLAYKFINYSSYRSILNEVEAFSDPEKTIFVSGKPSLLALYLLKKLKFRRTIVDIMDDFPYFFDGLALRSMLGLLENIVSCSDLAIFSSTKLLSKYGTLNKKSVLINNACDKSFIDTVDAIKSSMNDYKSDAITYGYIGSIAKWFDWDVVVKLAKENPDSKFRIIGPNYSLTLPQLPENIIIEPAIEHSKVPYVLQSFDYGLIPFRKNQLTDAVDPVKYYEYLSSGLKIISTEFGEMESRICNGNVYSFNNYKDKITIKNEKIITWDERFSPLFLELID